MKRRVTRVGIITLILFLLLALGARDDKEKEIKAASENAYPTRCLGGWRNPNNASGYPEVPGGSEFSESNSAVLRGQAAQIFCGYFESQEKTYPPKGVMLKFSWKLEFSAPPSSGEETTPSPDPDAEEWKETIQSEPPAVPPENVPPAAPLTEPPSENMSPPPENLPSSFLINRAIAQETRGGDVFEVTYTLDGNNWQTLGRINESNWQSFSPQISLMSWEDVERLQVQITPLPSVEMPTVFLDGLWLEVEYDKTLADSLQEGMETVVDFTSNIGETLGDIIDTAVEIVVETVQEALQPDTVVIPEEPKNETPLPVSPPEKIVFEFSIKDVVKEDVKELPWVPSSASPEITPSGKAPSVRLANDGMGLYIEGTCTKEYYVVLLFADPEGYLKDPSLAIINKAAACAWGTFKKLVDASDLPENLSDGTYYLLTADQGTKGTWVPNATVHKIEIKKKTTSQ